MSEVFPTVYSEMESLNREILYYADLHFNQEIDKIPNHVYDEKVQRFEELADAHPEIAVLFETATRIVPIHEPTGVGLKTIVLTEAMLSLKKALTHEQVQAFYNRFAPDTAYVYELKLDGLALEIEYVNWELVSIVTRGNGLVGENVTHSLCLFNNIPKDIPKTGPANLKVRGEGFISFSDFIIFNDLSEKKASNPRNAVSGWVRALPANQNQSVVNLLMFCIYWSDQRLGAANYRELRGKWEELGFVAAGLATKEAVEHNIQSPYWPTDGIVIKLDSFEDQDRVGVNSKTFNWAIAYKYPDVEKETDLLDIEWETARTGRVTPVGIYEAVMIGGVVCKRTSLDNYKRFLSLELRVGSKIAVSRAGDVIPRLNRVVDYGQGVKFEAPDECPTCSSVLEIRVSKTSANLVCTNTVECPAQLVMRCVHFAHKRTLNILDLGDVKIAQLVETGYIKRPADILTLNERVLGPKVFACVAKVRAGTAMHVIIKALGLPNIDLSRAKKLLKAWPVQVPLLTWLGDTKAIQKVPGFSAGLAFPMRVMLEDETFFKNATAILELITPAEMGEDTYEHNVCITGTLGSDRDELKAHFGDAGIELVEKVTKDCNLLILGERPGQAKILKATELGIPMFDATTVTSIDALIQLIKSGVSA